jgi:hypothetical protein
MPMNFLGGGSLEKIIIHAVLYLQSKVEKLIGHATITEDKCVQVDGQKYSAKHLKTCLSNRTNMNVSCIGNATTMVQK